MYANCHNESNRYFQSGDSLVVSDPEEGCGTRLGVCGQVNMIKASLTSGWIMLGQILTTDEEELNLTCRRLDPQTGEKQRATLNEIAM